MIKNSHPFHDRPIIHINTPECTMTNSKNIKTVKLNIISISLTCGRVHNLTKVYIKKIFNPIPISEKMDIFEIIVITFFIVLLFLNFYVIRVISIFIYVHFCASLSTAYCPAFVKPLVMCRFLFAYYIQIFKVLYS